MSGPLDELCRMVGAASAGPVVTPAMWGTAWGLDPETFAAGVVLHIEASDGHGGLERVNYWFEIAEAERLRAILAESIAGARVRSMTGD